MINHCDRRITRLSDTDISFGLFNLFTLICLLGDSKQHSKCKRNFENILNRTRYLQMTKKNDTSITVIYHRHSMSLTVL